MDEESTLRSTMLLTSSAAICMSRGDLSLRLFAAVSEVDRLDHLIASASAGSRERVEMQQLKDEWTDKIEAIGTALNRITPAMPRASMLEVPQLRLPQAGSIASPSGVVSGRRGSAIHFSTTNGGSLPLSRPPSSRRGPKTHIDADLRAIGILRPIPLVRQLPLSVIRRMKLWARAAKYSMRENKANALYEKRLLKQASVRMFAVFKAFYAASRLDRRMTLHKALRHWRLWAQMRLVRCERAAALLRKSHQRSRVRRLLYGWRYFTIMCGTIRGARVATNHVALLMLSDACKSIDPRETSHHDEFGECTNSAKRKWRRSLELLNAAGKHPQEATRKDRWEWITLYLMRPHTSVNNHLTDDHTQQSVVIPRCLLLRPPPQFDAAECSAQSLSHCFELKLSQLQRRLCLQRGWHALRGYARRRKLKVTLRVQAVEHHDRCRLNQAVWRWKCGLIIATVSRRMRSDLLRVVFGAWRGVATQRKAAASAVLRGRAAKDMAAKMNCFAKWRRRVPRAAELSVISLSKVHDGLRATGHSFLYELLWKWSADMDRQGLSSTNSNAPQAHAAQCVVGAEDPIAQRTCDEMAMAAAAITMRRRQEQKLVPPPSAEPRASAAVMSVGTYESFCLDTQWLRCRSIRGKAFITWRQFTLWHKAFEGTIGFPAQKYPDVISSRPALIPMANVWRRPAVMFLKRVVEAVWFGQELSECKVWCIGQRAALEKRAVELRAQRGFRCLPGDDEVTIATALFFAHDTTNVDKLLRYAGLIPSTEPAGVEEGVLVQCRPESRHCVNQHQVQLYYWMGKLEEFYLDVMEVKCLGTLAVESVTEYQGADDSPNTDGEQGGELDDDEDDDGDDPQSPTIAAADSIIIMPTEMSQPESYGSTLMKSRQWEIRAIGRFTCRLTARRYAVDGGGQLSTRVMGYTPSKVLINFYKLFVKKKGRRRKKKKKGDETKKGGVKAAQAPPVVPVPVTPESFSRNNGPSVTSSVAYGVAAPSSLIPKFSGEDIIAVTTLGVMTAPSIRTVDVTRSPSPTDGETLLPPIVEDLPERSFVALDDVSYRDVLPGEVPSVEVAIDLEVQRAAALAMASPQLLPVEAEPSNAPVIGSVEAAADNEIIIAPPCDDVAVEPYVAEPENVLVATGEANAGPLLDGASTNVCTVPAAASGAKQSSSDQVDDIDIRTLPKSVRSLQMFAWSKSSARAEPPPRALNNLLFGATEVCADFHIKGLPGQALRRKARLGVAKKFNLQQEV